MENDTDIQPDPAADPRAVLRGTAQLLASVPHLIGYQPGRSVVIMASRVDGTSRPGAGGYRAAVALTARFDLPEPEDAAAVVATLATPLAHAARGRRGPLLLHTFVYEADDAVAAAVSAEVAGLADAHGHRLHDLVLVRDDRYLPVVAAGEDAPEAWLPVPPPADVPAVADLVLQGRFAADSRDDVVARVRHRDEPAAAATELALSLLAMAPETHDPLDALGRLSRWVVRGDDDPAPRERACIVVALADRVLRDAVLARWLPRLFTLEDVLPRDMAREVRRAVQPWPSGDAGALDRLLGLAARVPEQARAPLLTVAGSVAWGQGEGTVANEAIDLALEVDGSYRMAVLMREAISQGLPPWVRRVDVA